VWRARGDRKRRGRAVPRPTLKCAGEPTQRSLEVLARRLDRRETIEKDVLFLVLDSAIASGTDADRAKAFAFIQRPARVVANGVRPS
jgi:hypothetical protein